MIKNNCSPDIEESTKLTTKKQLKIIGCIFQSSEWNETTSTLTCISRTRIYVMISGSLMYLQEVQKVPLSIRSWMIPHTVMVFSYKPSCHNWAQTSQWTLLALGIGYSNLCIVGLECLTLRMDSMCCPFPQTTTESISLHPMDGPMSEDCICVQDRKVRSLASILEMQAL